MTRESGPFKSRLGVKLEGFIAFKRANGYAYNCNAGLRRFDAFVADQFPDVDTLTRELCLSWASHLETEGRRGYEGRISLVREFARYLIMGGEDAYVIPPARVVRSPQLRETRFHIFTEEELVDFFSVADRIDTNHRSPMRHLAIPLYFRILYCCGLRPLEALTLPRKNIDYVREEFFIENSKGHKDRIVKAPPDLLAIVYRYEHALDKVYPGADHLFIKRQGRRGYETGQAPSTWFAKCWSKTPAGLSSGTHPRPYDFRHSFITMRIASWMAQGKDVDALMPVLMDYVGHERPDDTYYYYHLVPALFPTLNAFLDGSKRDLMPGVIDYVEN